MITVKEKNSDLILNPLTLDQILSLSFVPYDYYTNDKKAFMNIIEFCADVTKINPEDAATITSVLLQIFNISFYPDTITNTSFQDNFQNLFAKKDKTADDIARLTEFYNLFRYDILTLMNSRYELSTLTTMPLVDLGNMYFTDYFNSRDYHAATVVITRQADLDEFNQGFHPVFKAWYDALAVKPTAPLAKDLNDLISLLDVQGQLSKLDLFHPIGGMETLEQRETPIITNGDTTITLVGALTLTSDGIFSTGGHVDLGWNPFTDGVNFTDRDASFGVYSITDVDEDSYEMGNYDASDNTSHMRIRHANKFGYYCNQDATAYTPDVTNAESIGLHSVVRINSTQVSAYKNGSILDTEDALITSVPDLNMFLLARNDNGLAASISSRTISLFYAGAGSINQSILNARVNDYMIARGVI